jgi:hypothetical protein
MSMCMARHIWVLKHCVNNTHMCGYCYAGAFAAERMAECARDEELQQKLEVCWAAEH